ncbi:MAG: hypothetical protein MJZ29_07275 [Bacteroidaceae bacterium]|nr:hypothetical protein [Bacteroidaceae bacterium]
MLSKLFKVQHLALLLLCTLCSTQAMAKDYTCWTQAIYKMAVKGTSTTSTECGQIYVSTELVTDESQIAAVAEEITTDPIYHFGAAASCKQDYYYYVKANEGYNFIGWGTQQPSSASWKPASSSYAPNEANKVGDYYWYKSTTSSPYQDNTEAKPTKLTRYAVFEKVEKMEEPTGVTAVTFAAPTGTTSLAEGSVTKNFYVDLEVSEELPYDKPGSDLNAKPEEVLKQFVTVLGANGNKSQVASYSLVYEATDLGEGGVSGSGSFGTLYASHTIRLFFPYDIKADVYTVHLPYGLYTTKEGNKTPAYDFTLTVTEAANPYLTIKKQTPAEGLTYKYTASGQYSQDKTDPEKGLVSESNITVEIEFNEVVNSIDESKASGISLTNTTEGVNYRYKNLTLPAKLFAKVDGRTAIAYPELINGEYTMTIPEGLFVGTGDKVNEAITIHFSVTGFKNVTLKPYVMTTDEITPTPNHMLDCVERLNEITVSYKGEFGQAAALIGDASAITVKRYTEVITGEGEGATAKRTYYDDIAPVVSAKVAEGKLVVNFAPALATGLYEVNIPAGMVANMEAGDMTMVQKVNAGYAESPAHSNLTFNVESAVLEIPVSAARYASFYDSSMAYQVGEEATAYIFSKTEEKLVEIEDGIIPANTGAVIKAAKGDHYLTAVNSTSVYSDNALLGTDYETQLPADESKKFYALTLNEENDLGSVGFYWMNPTGAAFVNGAHKAYLVIEGEEAVAKAKAAYLFEDDATGISSVKNESTMQNAYNLNGVRVNESYKGIVVKNGKKVLNK